MPDPTTPNLGLYIPVNGADVGTWDIPMNANFNLLDTVLGGATSVALSNVNVTLSAAQYNSSFITFTGTLTGNVVITFPAIGRVYTVYNNCASATTFWVIGQNAGGGGTQVSFPPKEPVMVVTDGAAGNIRFIGLGRIGSYYDFAGSAVPLWISTTIPVPYLNCDGTAFSSATYPALCDYLGSAVLPDARGRFRAALNQGTARLPAYADTLLQSSGSKTIAQANIPSYNLTVTDPGHSHGVTLNPSAAGGYSLISAIGGGGLGNFNFAGADTALGTTVTVNSNFTGISVNSAGSGTAYSPPGYAGGLTLIRAG